VLLGVVGAFYNWIIIRLLRFADSLSILSSIQRAAVIGALVGLAGWFAPRLIGGGDNVTQAVLSGGYSIQILLIVFAFRLFIGPWSYAAGTPGGLFAPMLVLGATMGALLGGLMNQLGPNVGVTALDCAVVGMGAFFSACVRAPLTGILLAVEMTGRADLSLALLGASLAAVAVAMLLKSEPIYTTLKQRMLERRDESGSR